MTAAFNGVSEINFCSVLLNMVCGYPTGKYCVVCSGSLAFGCVLST